jgi:uncharacterized damage-inducible protein DinB
MDCPLCKREHLETDTRALAILSATPRRLEKLTSTLTPGAAVAHPMPGKWSAKEIIAHLNDGELIYGLRYRRIAAEPGTPLAAFDEKLWAKELQYRKQPLKANLESFAALRKQNLALLRVLPKSVWTQVSPHPEYGNLSLRDLVVHLANHDRSHTAQVERIASALGRNRKKRESTKKRRKAGRQRSRR